MVNDPFTSIMRGSLCVRAQLSADTAHKSKRMGKNVGFLHSQVNHFYLAGGVRGEGQ